MDAKTYRTEWNKKNPKKNAEYQRKWREANPTADRESTSAWKLANPERVQAHEKKRRGTQNWLAGSLRRKFNLTVQDYEHMLKLQRSVCAICEQPEKTRRLSVDHCHATGVVRGLLCRRCNVALGQFNDSPELLRAALKYLRRAKLRPAQG